jgi:hypothetical protein
MPRTVKIIKKRALKGQSLRAVAGGYEDGDPDMVNGLDLPADMPDHTIDIDGVSDIHVDLDPQIAPDFGTGDTASHTYSAEAHAAQASYNEGALAHFEDAASPGFDNGPLAAADLHADADHDISHMIEPAHSDLPSWGTERGPGRFATEHRQIDGGYQDVLRDQVTGEDIRVVGQHQVTHEMLPGAEGMAPYDQVITHDIREDAFSRYERTKTSSEFGSTTAGHGQTYDSTMGKIFTSEWQANGDYRHTVTNPATEEYAVSSLKDGNRFDYNDFGGQESLRVEQRSSHGIPFVGGVSTTTIAGYSDNEAGDRNFFRALNVDANVLGAHVGTRVAFNEGAGTTSEELAFGFGSTHLVSRVDHSPDGIVQTFGSRSGIPGTMPGELSFHHGTDGAGVKGENLLNLGVGAVLDGGLLVGPAKVAGLFERSAAAEGTAALRGIHGTAPEVVVDGVPVDMAAATRGFEVNGAKNVFLGDDGGALYNASTKDTFNSMFGTYSDSLEKAKGIYPEAVAFDARQEAFMPRFVDLANQLGDRPPRDIGGGTLSGGQVHLYNAIDARRAEGREIIADAIMAGPAVTYRVASNVDNVVVVGSEWGGEWRNAVASADQYFAFGGGNQTVSEMIEMSKHGPVYAITEEALLGKTNLPNAAVKIREAVYAGQLSREQVANIHVFETFEQGEAYLQRQLALKNAQRGLTTGAQLFARGAAANALDQGDPLFDFQTAP